MSDASTKLAEHLRLVHFTLFVLTYSPQINQGDSGFKRGWPAKQVLHPLIQEKMPLL